MGIVLKDRKIRPQSFVDGVFPIKRSKPEVSKKIMNKMEDFEYWQILAKKLDSSVLANDITMQEIVDEVNAVRKERYEKQNSI